MIELIAVFMMIFLPFYAWVVHIEPRRRKD